MAGALLLGATAIAQVVNSMGFFKKQNKTLEFTVQARVAPATSPYGTSLPHDGIASEMSQVMML